MSVLATAASIGSIVFGIMPAIIKAVTEANEEYKDIKNSGTLKKGFAMRVLDPVIDIAASQFDQVEGIKEQVKNAIGKIVDGVAELGNRSGVFSSPYEVDLSPRKPGPQPGDVISGGKNED